MTCCFVGLMSASMYRQWALFSSHVKQCRGNSPTVFTLRTHVFGHYSIQERLEIALTPSSTLPQTKQHRTAKAHQRCRVMVYKTSHSRTDPGSVDERCWKCTWKQESERSQRRLKSVHIRLWHKMAASDVTTSEIKCFWVKIWHKYTTEVFRN